MEGEDAEHEDAENEHVLGGPGVCPGPGSDLIALQAAALAIILDAEPDAEADVDDETQREDRDHDVHEGGGHEVAAELEIAVSEGIELFVGGNSAELALDGVDDGEEIDRSMEKQEENKESAADALDELLADGGFEEACHYV